MEKVQPVFIVLAAIQWKLHMQAAEASARGLEPGRFLELKYEELCAEPMIAIKRVADFCGLEWNGQYQGRLKEFRIRSANEKWQSDLNEAQKRDLQACLASSLARYGYT